MKYTMLLNRIVVIELRGILPPLPDRNPPTPLLKSDLETLRGEREEGGRGLGLSKDTDTTDARKVCAIMLTVGSGGMGKLGLRTKN